MPIAQAVRLCPAATFFQGEFAHYRHASRAVRDVLQRFSPVIVMASLDEAYLDFTGTDRLYPTSLLPVAERIRDAINHATGLDASIGIGPNRMIAKIASGMAKPRGLLEVRTGWEEGFMAGLALSAIPGIGPKTAHRLTGLGLTDVAQIQAMRRSHLEQLVGKDAAKSLKRRAHGHGGTALRGRAEAWQKSVSRETTLAQDMKEREPLERILGLLTARVGAQLRDSGLATRTVTLKLRHGDFRTITRQRTLSQPTDLDREIWREVRELFRAAYLEVERRGKGVRLVGVGATNLVPAGPSDLFEPPARERLRRLTTAVDKARAKYGFHALTPGILLGTRRRSTDRPGADQDPSSETGPEDGPATRSPSSRT